MTTRLTATRVQARYFRPSLFSEQYARVCARVMGSYCRWGPGRVPTQTKPTGNPVYLTGGSTSQSGSE
jgi:hypothetical protein